MSVKLTFWLDLWQKDWDKKRKHPETFWPSNSEGYFYFKSLLYHSTKSTIQDQAFSVANYLAFVNPDQKQPPEVFYKKGVLRNVTKFTGKHLFLSLFFNKVAGTLLKKRLWHRCFPVNFVTFLRTPFQQNTSERLLLPDVYFLPDPEI